MKAPNSPRRDEAKLVKASRGFDSNNATLESLCIQKSSADVNRNKTVFGPPEL